MSSVSPPPLCYICILLYFSLIRNINSILFLTVQSYRILWTGLGAQLARDVPFSAICWSTLEPVRYHLFQTLQWIHYGFLFSLAPARKSNSLTLSPAALWRSGEEFLDWWVIKPVQPASLGQTFPLVLSQELLQLLLRVHLMWQKPGGR